MNGWIKLHKQILKNKVFRHDRTAWHIFECLLIICDTKTGEWSGGRYVLADLCEIKPITTYKALLRLKTAGMVTLTSNNKYTSIRICNWSKYQGNGNTSSNIRVTSKEHQDNTIKRNKNKEIRNTNVLAKAPKPEINELFDYWQQTTGIPISSKTQANRYAANNLLKKHGVGKVKQLIDGVAQAQSDQYAPRIADFTQLQGKLSELLVWGKGRSKNNVEVI